MGRCGLAGGLAGSVELINERERPAETCGLAKPLQQETGGRQAECVPSVLIGAWGRRGSHGVQRVVGDGHVCVCVCVRACLAPCMRRRYLRLARSFDATQRPYKKITQNDLLETSPGTKAGGQPAGVLKSWCISIEES